MNELNYYHQQVIYYTFLFLEQKNPAFAYDLEQNCTFVCYINKIIENGQR